VSAHSELLTPSEAAVVAGVSVRDVHRVIDEEIVPKSLVNLKGGRRLRSSACAYVRFYFHAAHALTADERSWVILSLAAHKPQRWTIKHGFLTVSLDRFAKETDERHAALKRARELVIEDPELLGGTPVLRGTRVPVYDVAAAVAAGQSERLKSAYPDLDDEKIELATLYAQANPPRGRPPTRSPAETGMTVLSEKRVPRRHRS
jgi:uncharacterized protein (DUF433 family)